MDKILELLLQAIFLLFINAILVKVSWNYVITKITNMRRITYYESIALVVLVSALLNWS